ncbi:MULTISPECIES: hypothetical protein [Microbacterium]|uniref:Uncharacterized protein n=1 Tax=Microbacterium trichothecenolyticum TaxID=69370 RepID=A0A0M2HLC7_MICTR|nr:MULTISPECIES: hypothetical protein [Microbacterium]KJL45212.1 hypothetical protein RS82_00399 [Microbacterium trichothecenolyticum]MDR7187257.1 hypothetical protein [Microbacterium sp. BE35]
MFAVYAAEQQYRHDTWSRDREHAILASIRERRTAAAVRRPARVIARPQRVAWARPIGLHVSEHDPAVCAVA